MFNKQEQEIIKYGLENGKTKSEVEQAILNFRRKTPVSSPEIIEQEEEKPGFLSRASSALKERFGEVKKTFGEAMRGDISPVETGVRVFGDVAGGGMDVFGAVISPAIEKLAEKEWAKPAFEKLAQGMDKYEEWKNSSEINRRTAEVIEGVANIADLAGITAGAKATAKGTVKVAGKVGRGLAEATEQTGKVLTSMTDDVISGVRRVVPEMAERGAKWLASEPDEAIKTVLKEVPTNKIDDFAKIAKAKSMDVRNPSVFEKVSESFTQATKQINNQLKSIGKQKQNIINQAKVGLQEFKDAPRRAILSVNKIKDIPDNLKKEVIAKLKTVNTKLKADQVIDELQELIYTNTRNLTLPQGGKIERQLQGIIGKMNSELKDTLPEAYRTLNAKYAKNREVLDILNKSLGETVEGTSFGGAGLVKRFFSPSSQKTRTLFDFIKKNTGIDLAQDAVLAKFFGDLYGDTTGRMLLEGIPTTKRGLLEKALEIFGKKTGISGKIDESLKEATIKSIKE